MKYIKDTICEMIQKTEDSSLLMLVYEILIRLIK